MSWMNLFIKLLSFLLLVGCLYYDIKPYSHQCDNLKCRLHLPRVNMADTLQKSYATHTNPKKKHTCNRVHIHDMFLTSYCNVIGSNYGRLYECAAWPACERHGHDSSVTYHDSMAVSGFADISCCCGVQMAGLYVTRGETVAMTVRLALLCWLCDCPGTLRRNPEVTHTATVTELAANWLTIFIFGRASYLYLCLYNQLFALFHCVF